MQSFPDPTGSRHQVSIGGGAEPRWTKGGKELVYRTGDSIMAVSVDLTSGQIGRPVALFGGTFIPVNFGAASYDVTPDGNRFLMVKRLPEPGAAADEHRSELV